MKKKSSIFFYFLIFVIIVVGVLFINAIVNSTDRLNVFASLGYSEILFVIPIFLLILLFSIWGLIGSSVKNQKVKRKYFAELKGLPQVESEKKSKSEKKEKRPRESRFYLLTETDRRAEEIKNATYDRAESLEEICEKFRGFCASRLKLYYSISDIRRFISGMATSHVLIMQGMSGTGKTSLAYAFGEFLKNPSTIVPIQPMWKERTDIIGYYNEFTKKFNETILLQKMYEANYSDGIYVTVLDEMNIARIEYYFAEFLSLLEIPNADSRKIEVVTDEWENDPKLLDEGQLKLPTNMWFIGTANNDDSTFAISDKVYDRAMIMCLDKKSEVFYTEDQDGMRISFANFIELVNGGKKEYRITKRNERRIKELDEYMINRYHITFGNRIMKQMKEYVSAYMACGGKEEEGIDDIVSKKIMRKLETQNPVYIRNSIDELCENIDRIFGEDNMNLTKEYLHRLERTL